MKTAVIYTSKYGMTEKLANIMVRHRTNVHLFTIKEFQNNFEDYSEIIIGTPIYAGRINKKISKFINKHQSQLLEKELRIFLCGMAKKNEDEVITLNFTDEIIEHAKIKYTGGAYQFSKMNFFFRSIVKRIAKTNQDQEEILNDNIEFLLK